MRRRPSLACFPRSPQTEVCATPEWWVKRIDTLTSGVREVVKRMKREEFRALRFDQALAREEWQVPRGEKGHGEILAGRGHARCFAKEHRTH
jgi:hypothetical protein